MSACHGKGESGRGTEEGGTKGTRISSEVVLSLEAIRQRAEEALLALCVGAGLNTLGLLFERELEEKIPLALNFGVYAAHTLAGTASRANASWNASVGMNPIAPCLRRWL